MWHLLWESPLLFVGLLMIFTATVDFVRHRRRRRIDPDTIAQLQDTADRRQACLDRMADLADWDAALGITLCKECGALNGCLCADHAAALFADAQWTANHRMATITHVAGSTCAIGATGSIGVVGYSNNQWGERILHEALIQQQLYAALDRQQARLESSIDYWSDKARAQRARANWQQYASDGGLQ